MPQTLPQTLHRLTYFSRSLLRGPAWFVEAEIERLRHTSEARNRAAGITGSLLFNDGCFAQILEGPAAALDRLFAAICADPRHSHVTVLQEVTATARAFPDTPLSYIGPTLTLPPRGAAVPLFERIEQVARGEGPSISR
ncbi:FAD-dependent sensor of blue light [Humitalea rosea]|uniref:FAD-dependent sensor of blue light n=1 Tax=Humitalea rosea TaxID=990373 RepID=A0A2W7IMH2_9PROT|nr:BLUF domain-containing protein [Humitalea rosea]PZW48385.1 FAD-dependent sensor of blue light [Humitalea rosea]